MSIGDFGLATTVHNIHNKLIHVYGINDYTNEDMHKIFNDLRWGWGPRDSDKITLSLRVNTFSWILKEINNVYIDFILIYNKRIKLTDDQLNSLRLLKEMI